jgi:hypothetical protein
LLIQEIEMKLWRKLLWLGALSGTLASFALVLSASGETEEEGTLTLMITASSQGELLPCG